MKRLGLWAVLFMLIVWSAWQFLKPVNAPQSALKGKVHAMTLTPEYGSTIRFEKQKNKWVLIGIPIVPANNESVQHLLDDLASMHIIRVVTHTHAHDNELGMNKRGTKLTLSDNTGTRLLDLIIGKQGSDLISTYVRIGESPEVLAVDKALVWQVRRDRNAWKAPLSKPEGVHHKALLK